MSRSGSMTTPTPRSVSATRKLVFPSSGAGMASIVNIRLAQRDRHCREEDPDRDQGDHDGAAVKDRLGGHALCRRHPEVDQQVAQPVREMEEGNRDQDQQVELDYGVAENA